MAAGAVIMAVAAVSAVVNRNDVDGEHAADAVDASPAPGAAALLAGVLKAERRAVDVFQAAYARMQPVVDAARPSVLRRPIDGLRASRDELAEQGVSDAESGADLLLQILDAVLTRVVHDVLQHIDLNELLRSLDIDALLERIDVQAVVDRIDPNPLLRRIDVDALVRRVDVGSVAQRVIDEIQIGDLVRESTGTLSVETVDALRRAGGDADGRLARLVDSILRRKNGRDTAMTLDGEHRQATSDRSDPSR
jgi:hypothetical protein